MRVFSLAESLGGVESLIEHPAIMTHASVPAETRARLGIGDALVRLLVGVEAVEDLRDHLGRRQIGSEVYYPQPMHLQECFANLGYRKGEYPESERAALTTLALPIYPELTAAQKKCVVDAIACHYQVPARQAGPHAA